MKIEEVFKKDNYNKNLFLLAKFTSTAGYLVFALITYVLLKTLKIDNKLIGSMLTLITITKIPGILLGGKLSDHYNIKYVSGLLQTLSGLLLCFCPLLFRHKYLVVAVLCIVKFLLGTVSPSNTKIMNILVNTENRRELFAKVYWFSNIGGAIASLAGGFLFFYSSTLVFIIDGITNIASGIAILQLKNIGKGTDNNIQNNAKGSYKEVFTYLREKKQIYLYILFTLVFMFIYIQYSYAIPLTLNDNFIEKSTKVYSIILFINSITVITLTNYVAKLLKNVSAIRCLAYAFGILSAGFIWYIFKLNIAVVIISTIFWTLGEIIYGINELIYITEQTEKEYLGRVMGIYDSLHNLMMALAPLLNSILIILFGLKISWIIIVALAVIMFGVTFCYDKYSISKGQLHKLSENN